MVGGSVYSKNNKFRHELGPTFQWGNGNLLNSVYFPDASTGYAVGEDGSDFKNHKWRINWTILSNFTGDRLYSVYFTDANTGYIAGWFGPFSKQSMAAYRGFN